MIFGSNKLNCLLNVRMLGLSTKPTFKNVALIYSNEIIIVSVMIFCSKLPVLSLDLGTARSPGALTSGGLPGTSGTVGLQRGVIRDRRPSCLGKNSDVGKEKDHRVSVGMFRILDKKTTNGVSNYLFRNYPFKKTKNFI